MLLTSCGVGEAARPEMPAEDWSVSSPVSRAVKRLPATAAPTEAPTCRK